MFTTMDEEPTKPKSASKMIWVLVGLSPIPIVLIESWLVSIHRATLNNVGFTCVIVNAIASGIGAFQLARKLRANLTNRTLFCLLLTTGFAVVNLIGGITGCCMIYGIDVH